MFNIIKKQNTITVLYAVLLFAVFSISIYSVYRYTTLGNKNSDFKKICIEEHIYYKASFVSKGFMAIKLDTDGKPIKCVKNE